MDINSLFPSNYLKASDLQGQVRRVTIEACQPEQLSQCEIKPALQFRGVPKKLILNKTNGLLIAARFGAETEAWSGREIELYPENVMFQGQVVPAIRVRVPIGAAQAPAAAADPFAQAAPPPAQQPPAAPQQAEQAPAAAAPQPPPEQAAPPAQVELPIDW